MGETGEGIGLTRSVDRQQPLSAKDWLKDQKEQASKTIFKQAVSDGWRNRKKIDPDPAMSAAVEALVEADRLLRGPNVQQKLLSVYGEDTRVKLGKVCSIHVSGGSGDRDLAGRIVGHEKLPIIRVDVGREWFEIEGGTNKGASGHIYNLELNAAVEKSRTRSWIKDAIGSLGNLTPREIVEAFIKTVDYGDDARRRAYKQDQRQATRELGRGK